MAKKRFWEYKNKTLFDGYKLLQEYHDTKCPTGPGHLCGFPIEFIEKTMNKVKRLLAENKRLRKKVREYEEIISEWDYTKNLLY